MKNRKQIYKNYQVYSQKRSNLEKRLEDEYLDHGIATIPCKVSEMDEIISSYSVAGYESLNSSFVEYVGDIVDVVPDFYPIVLSIVGKKFTKEEQNVIRSTIEDDFAYDLGIVEKENRHHLKVFLWMAAGLALTSILLSVFNWWGTLPTELLFVFFWFFAATFVDYLLREGRELRKQRIKAARLACLRVEFSEEYDESDYSEREAEEFFKDLYHPTKRI